MARLGPLAGATVGTTGTLALRDMADEAGDSSLFRPSVLFGVGLGGGALVAGTMMENGNLGSPVGNARNVGMIAQEFGLPALTTGLYSAFFPKGQGGFTVPSL